MWSITVSIENGCIDNTNQADSSCCFLYFMGGKGLCLVALLLPISGISLENLGHLPSLVYHKSISSPFMYIACFKLPMSSLSVKGQFCALVTSHCSKNKRNLRHLLLFFHVTLYKIFVILPNFFLVPSLVWAKVPRREENTVYCIITSV